VAYNPYFYNSTFKNILTEFINLFDGLILHKVDTENNFIQNITVPVMFAPITKAQMTNLEGPHAWSVDNVEISKRFYMTVPRIGISLDSISFDPERCTGLTEARNFYGNALAEDGIDIDTVFQDNQPIPWNIGVTAHIRSSSLDFLMQILEQHLILFSPKYFLRVKEFSFLNIDREIPIQLDSVNPVFTDDQTSTDDRKIDCNLSYTINMFLYKPLTRASIIKCIKSKYFIGDIPELDVELATSGVQLTSAGIPYPTSAVPDPTSYFFSGTNIDGIKNYEYFQGLTSAGY
jgi:hypothetical protein